MKEHLIRYLVCPDCRGSLRYNNIQKAEKEIKEGLLICEVCKKQYPIRNFIPRFAEGELCQAAQKTQRAWGYQWTVFDELHESYKEQFLDWIAPITPDFFQGKVIADAGCGMGRFTRLAAEFGARDVIGFDISPAVESAWKLSGRLDNLHFIQADIHSLPLKADFDLVYSIGVLHHLPDPEQGFRDICRLLNNGGTLSIWVYGYENNEFIVKYLNPFRENVTSRIPLSVLYFLTFILNVSVHIVLKSIYLPVDSCNTLKFFKPFLPYRDYLSWLARYNFRHNHHVIFDHLVAPIAHYIPRREIEGWFLKEGMSEVSITSRNNNSWRGSGILKMK